ncbi:maleate isomerase [Jatrophihabitans sp. GAS493]|uniref:maleate cis-trans isomerase family protein n=1 Tax=Jatrophihabitans sp. GAS493 TaxID=1907575 RepID=UPI000BB7333E|nr:aspartate/glutamate racemase family protein [Jatrophihabitans sp. GAS493]SOD74233.1 maleate isomerase [Jatrophihabitans sp. GAS493]
MRIGLIVPSSNTVLEPAISRLLRLLGGSVSAHFARVVVQRIGLDSEASDQFAVERFLPAAEALADAKVDAIVWAGTSGSWLGVEHDREVADRIRQLTGIPASTSTLALLAACRAFGVSRLGIATPYTQDVNREIARCYSGEGIEVVSADGLGRTDNHSFAQVSAEVVERQLLEVGSGAQGVAVVCTNVLGCESAEKIEAALGVPVFDSVSATLWHALTLGGWSGTLSGDGRLLAGGYLRERLQQITDDLLVATGADRTTLRIDLPAHHLGVDLAAAESRRPGVRSIRWEASLDQRALDTVQWLERHRQLLIQPAFTQDPFPPPALRDIYGVRAQLLGPVERDSSMIAWLSAHSLVERLWSESDRAAMNAAIIATSKEIERD